MCKIIASVYLGLTQRHFPDISFTSNNKPAEKLWLWEDILLTCIVEINSSKCYKDIITALTVSIIRIHIAIHLVQLFSWFMVYSCNKYNRCYLFFTYHMLGTVPRVLYTSH